MRMAGSDVSGVPAQQAEQQAPAAALAALAGPALRQRALVNHSARAPTSGLM